MMRTSEEVKFLWITDPWDQLNHDKDTTLRLASQAILQGHDSYWCSKESISLSNNGVLVLGYKLNSPVFPDKSHSNIRSEAKVYDLNFFDSIHYRCDPPVDITYLHPLLLLEKAPSFYKQEIEFVNPISVLMARSEKVECLTFNQHTPPTYISARIDDLLSFLRQHKRAVLKPLNSSVSRGVELLESADIDHAKRRLEAMTVQFSRPILLQKYVSEVEQGEKRIWFLDGTILSTSIKLPTIPDFRLNSTNHIHIQETQLSQSERRIVSQISAHLKLQKIRLAAVDLIQDFVIDFNFTSPGLLVQIEKAHQKNYAEAIINRLINEKL